MNMNERHIKAIFFFFKKMKAMIYLVFAHNISWTITFICMGAFKYYVIKEVGGWGQKRVIFGDLQYWV